jgi:hypothetical protein
MKVTLAAISSSGNGTYSVDFLTNDEGKLSVFCDCPAGEWGKFCKHKWRLLHGDESMLADQTQIDDLQKVAEIAKDRNIEQFDDEIKAYEKEQKNHTKQLKKEKEIRDRILSKKAVSTFEAYAEASAEVFAIEQKQSYNKYLSSKNREILEKKFREGI